MLNMWILYASIYATIIGFFSVFKKKATARTNTLFVLAFHSTLGFLLLSWTAFFDAFKISSQSFLFLLLKSFIVAFMWIFELIALKKYYISSLQPISSIKVVIGFVAGIIIFSEPFVWWKCIGVAIIFVGLIMLNLYDKKHIVKFEPAKNNLQATPTLTPDEQQQLKRNRITAIILFLLSCILSETSAILDKFILTNVSPNQMQFWFMMFVSIILWICFFASCIKNKKVLVSKSDFKNFYIYLIACILIVADRFLFTSLSQPDVLVSGVSVIKQISIIVSVIFGGLWFKEPKLKNKLIFLAIILAGIIIVLI